MNDEGVTAILGLVLLAQGGEIRVPSNLIEEGLPDNSGVQVYQDELTNELVVRVANYSKEPE